MKSIMRRFVFWTTAVATVVALGFVAACGRKQQTEAIRVGAILPLTGPAAFLGEEERKGLEAMRTLLEAEIGRPVQILYEDSQNESKLAINAYSKLSQVDRVPAVIVTHSGVAGPISEFVSTTGASGEQPLILATIVASTKITKNNSVVYRVYPSGADEAAAIARYAFAELKIARPAIFYQNDDYGLDALSHFTALAASNGSAVLASEPFAKDAVDHRSTIEKILAKTPDSVYVVGNTPAFASAVRQLREAGFTGVLLSGSGLEVGKIRQAAGPALIGTVYTAAFTISPTMETSAVFAAYSKALSQSGTQPNMLNVYPAVCLDIAVQAMRQPQNVIGAALGVQISSRDHKSLLGTISFDESRNARLPVFVRKAVDVDPAKDQLLAVDSN